jgi:hypothetical protein
MQRSKCLVWISAAILAGALQGTVPAPVFAQTLTRQLDSPMRGERYAEHFTVFFAANDFVGKKTVTPLIPDGKKLFLQSVSMHTVLSNGQNVMQATVAIHSDRDAIAFLYIDMDFQAVRAGGGETKDRHSTGNRDINMVLNAGESMTVEFLRNGNQGPPLVNFNRVTFIGYLVDVDPLTPPVPD